MKVLYEKCIDKTGITGQDGAYLTKFLLNRGYDNRSYTEQFKKKYEKSKIFVH